MIELAKAINNYTEASDDDTEILEEASLLWAKRSLCTYSGKLRKKAIDISIALMDFVDEYKLELEKAVEKE